MGLYQHFNEKQSLLITETMFSEFCPYIVGHIDFKSFLFIDILQIGVESVLKTEKLKTSSMFVMAFSHDIHLVKQCALSVFCFVLLYHVLHSLMLYLSLFLTPRVRLIILKRQNHHRYVMIS